GTRIPDRPSLALVECLLDQRPGSLTAPRVEDELFELLDLDLRKPHEDGRKSVVVRLGRPPRSCRAAPGRSGERPPDQPRSATSAARSAAAAKRPSVLTQPRT